MPPQPAEGRVLLWVVWLKRDVDSRCFHFCRDCGSCPCFLIHIFGISVRFHLFQSWTRGRLFDFACLVVDGLAIGLLVGAFPDFSLEVSTSLSVFFCMPTDFI